MVAPAAVALFMLDKYQGAIAVSGMAIVNTVIGLVQEIRAKRYLDKLAILVETKARVIRDGNEQEIPASQVVLGEHIHLMTGEAIVADGPVIEDRFLEVDEALLTGESDPVRKRAGDQLLSGSFCVAGEGIYRADKVGAEAFAHSTSAQARRYSYADSPLTQIINFLIYILSCTALGLCVLYWLVWYLAQSMPTDDLVQWIAATITSMVPQGMVLTATVAFTLGAVHMSARGAIVQRLNAVEAMAAVDVVCTDKTGTLTTNRLKVDQVRVVGEGISAEEVRRLLSVFASASVDRKNKSVQALLTEFGRSDVELLDQLPFKSQNRYSAVQIRDGNAERVLALGACESLRDYLEPGADSKWEAAWQELLQAGLRILMFAESTRRIPFAGTLEGYPLRPLAIIALSDELRPDAGQVLEALAAQGIAFKVISGDNAETVRATVSHLNLPLARDPVVTGAELDAAGDKKGELLVSRSVFGRVAPLQKVEIVDALKERGHYVAMIGDGVNDVLSIKRAHLGIAMGEGSQASKAVSGLVLENNNFALLPETLEEGRTIIRNLRRSGKLFLVKNVYSLILLTVGSLGLFGLPFPYLPQQVTLLNWLVIGIPAFIIALSRERSTAATKPKFLLEVGWFAIRTGVVFALAGLAVLLLSVHLWPGDEKTQRTMLLSTLILLGITALLRALTDAEPRPLRGDTKFRWLAIAAVPVYLLAMYWSFPANFFQLVPLSLQQWGLVLAVVAPAFLVSKLTDRWQV
jgi:cation-transporting ATPase E